MRTNKVEEAVMNYYNGNISDFRSWLKKASKSDMLDAIDLFHSHYGLSYPKAIETFQRNLNN